MREPVFTSVSKERKMSLQILEQDRMRYVLLRRYLTQNLSIVRVSSLEKLLKFNP